MLQPSPPALLWGGYAPGSDIAGFCGGSVAVMAIKTAHALVVRRERTRSHRRAPLNRGRGSQDCYG